ncbi:hypothetical protein GIY62_10860 [Burkholderia plantarii]|uniref:hypothetical protein n=1 Tax=Burkholderia plantarii TaxID=41899 RepID=UPI00272C0A1D|nr:hypothetical protein [Burkholderia plantarii]WLE57666.1 hypothetical protein GIY62_10860 [Burkholderia plantarii]
MLPGVEVALAARPPSCQPSRTCTACSTVETAFGVSTSVNGESNANDDGVLPGLGPHIVATQVVAGRLVTAVPSEWIDARKSG